MRGAEAVFFRALISHPSPELWISRYRSFMELPNKHYRCAFFFGTSPILVKKQKGLFCGRSPILVLTFLASALAVVAAQTGASRSAGINDHLRKAAEYLKANDPNSAVKEFDAVLALDPRNADAYANLGVIAFFQHDYQDAAQHLRKALAIDPSLAKTQALLGLCEERLGNPSARALLEKSFPKLKDKALRIQVGMELAGIHDREGDLDGAASVMRSLVDIDPDNVDILFLAQRIYVELADNTLNKLAILAPGSARMQQAIAERLVNGGDLKHAIEHYKKALEIDPHIPGVRFELAESILEFAPNDSAAQAESQKELETVISTEGDSTKVECVLGEMALQRADSEGAHDHYSRAFAMNPANTDAQLGMGRVLMTLEKPQEARKYLEMAVQSDPLNGEARYRLALAYRGLGMNNEAQKQMHLFQEIKQTKDQVKELYRQMNKQSKSDNLDTLEGEK